MKKVLIVICISAFLASCGGDTKSTDATKDSVSTMTTDTTTKMAPDTTNKMAPDTTKMADTTKAAK